MERKKRKCYSEVQLSEAITAVNRGMTIYQASKQYHIPETTLRDKRDGKYTNDKPGLQPVLTLSEETNIVDWIHYLGRAGFPVTKEQLLDVVAKLVKNLSRTNPFKDGVPGRYWFEGFLKRHPTVSKRVAQNLPTTRNQLTEENIRAWFERVRAYFEANGLLHIFEEPQRIFNCDETGFFLSPKEKQVLVKRGSKRVYNRVANDEKECLTVLVNVAADGTIAPPMVLFPYKRVPPYIKASVPSWWGLGNTDSGWMTMEAFYEYVTNVFFPWLLQKKITLPVALFLDGHTSHISLPLSTFCKDKGIILVALLPNATHVLQPLDVAVFRPVKGTWRAVVHNYRVENNYTKLTREEFSKEVQKCFDQSLKPDTIKSGFQCCGICPFNPHNINYDKLLEKVKKHAIKEAVPVIISSEAEKDKDLMFKEEFEGRLSPVTLFAFQTTENE